MRQTIETTKRRELKISVLEDMHSGKILKRMEIAEKYGVSERLVRDVIAELNMEGHAIVSVGDGFHLARDKREIEHAAAILRKQALTTIRRASSLLGISPESYAKGLAEEIQSNLFAENV